MTNWKPVTLDELRELGRSITSEFVSADSLPALYEKLNADYASGWVMLRSPCWCGSLLVALVVKPRE